MFQRVHERNGAVSKVAWVARRQVPTSPVGVADDLAGLELKQVAPDFFVPFAYQDFFVAFVGFEPTRDMPMGGRGGHGGVSLCAYFPIAT